MFYQVKLNSAFQSSKSLKYKTAWFVHKDMLEFSSFPFELDDAKKSTSFKGANNTSKPSKQNKKEKSSNATKQSNKLKILCIHGYRQNEKMFREKTGAFRKIVGKYADLVFITAPHFVKPIDEEDPNQVTSLLTQYHVNTMDKFQGGCVDKLFLLCILVFAGSERMVV